MVEGTQGFLDNKDGTFTYEFEAGKPVKFVKASDLMDYKAGSEKKSTELMSQLAESNRVKDEAHQNFLKEKAAREQFEVTAKEVEAHKTKVTEWEQKSRAAEESGKKMAEQLLARTKAHIALQYGTKEDVLKDKSQDDLLGIEKALQVVGPQGGRKANFDGSGGGAVGGKPPESNDERLDRILIEAKDRNKR